MYVFINRLHNLGFNRLAIGPEAHREKKDNLPDPRKEYYKFMIVRHPMERLASAYLDKMKGKTVKTGDNKAILVSLGLRKQSKAI